MHSKQSIIKNYNIYYYQVVDPRLIADKGAQVTIGDMHANSCKFISVLVKHGFLELTRHGQEVLSQIYNKFSDELTKKDYNLYCKIIRDAKVKPEAREAILRLIGDEFADRGLGDHFTLPIMEKLCVSGIQWSVCLSNHSISLIRCYEKNWKFKATDVNANCCNSINQLQNCIDKGIIGRNKVDEMIKKYYLPHLKIADYTINEHQQVTHYIHAPFGDNSIVAMANQLGVEYDSTSATTEKDSLDKMEIVFQEEYVKRGKISTLFDNCKIENDLDQFLHEKVEKSTFPSKQTAISESVWNRKRSHLKRNNLKRYVNGHDLVGRKEIVPENVIELDNNLGKEIFEDSFYKIHSYHIYYTHETKEFDNPYFKEIDQLVVNPDVEKIFGKAALDSLIKKNMIYSRVQIQCLDEFLCSDDSFLLWRKLLGEDGNNHIKFLLKLNRNYELWDVLFLLKKHNLLDEISFGCIVNNSENSEKVYQILLILREYDLLKPENDIHILLANKYHLDMLYGYLIEYAEVSGDDEINYVDTIISTLNLIHNVPLYCDKAKALNALNILYPDSINHLNEENINEYMYNELKVSGDNNRVIEYFKELEAIYFESIEIQSNSMNDIEDVDGVNNDSRGNEKLIIDSAITVSPTNDDFEILDFYKKRNVYEGLLKNLNIPPVIISMSITIIDFCHNKIALQDCLIELFQSSFDKNFKLSRNFLSQLLNSVDMMNTLLVIWPMINDKDSDIFKAIFENDSIVNVMNDVKLIHDTSVVMTLDQLLLISKSTKATKATKAQLEVTDNENKIVKTSIADANFTFFSTSMAIANVVNDRADAPGEIQSRSVNEGKNDGTIPTIPQDAKF